MSITTECLAKVTEIHNLLGGSHCIEAACVAETINLDGLKEMMIMKICDKAIQGLSADNVFEKLDNVCNLASNISDGRLQKKCFDRFTSKTNELIIAEVFKQGVSNLSRTNPDLYHLINDYLFIPEAVL
ncbi:MAG TPA: hypothetical protein VJK48_02030 [Chlamydiales bacterium]|nr:hypothetical protein [Chlamydiales bacterium]